MGWGGCGLWLAVAPSLRGQVLLSFHELFLLLARPCGSDHGVVPSSPSSPDLGWVVWPALRLAASYFPVCLGFGLGGLDGVACFGTFGDWGGPLCGPGLVLVAPPCFMVLGAWAVVWSPRQWVLALVGY